jgi:aerobic carbon-monoxide dehydrogenase medium subunit
VKHFLPEQYDFPESLSALTATLREEGDSARVIAGGTTIHELAYHKGMGNVRRLLDITRLPLRYVESDSGDVRIGATTTFTDLRKFVCARAPQELAVLDDAISMIRPMQVRNVGTVGGSICSSLPYFDLPVALVALDAEVTSVGHEQSRTRKLEEFFWDFFVTDLGFGEVVTEVRLPLPDSRTSGAFLKFELNAVDWALVSVAVTLRRDGDRLDGVRIALGGGIGRTVTRARHVEAALEGQSPTPDLIAAAVSSVEDDVKALNDFRASAAFRKHLLKVHVRRCIDQALARIP